MKELPVSFCEFRKEMKVVLEGKHKVTVVIFVSFTYE